MAGTGLDEHHALFHDLTIWALELHRKGGGSVRGTASAICAHSTELSSVRLHAGAAGKFKLDRLGDFGGADALFALLRKTKEERKISDSVRGVAFLTSMCPSLCCLASVYIECSMPVL